MKILLVALLPLLLSATVDSACSNTTLTCGKQDIVFFLDSSGSISKAEFDVMEDFIIALIELSDEYGDNGIRVGVVVFAKYRNLKIAFGFNSYNTKQDVIDAIRNIEKFSPGQTTQLYHAITTALPIVMENARIGNAAQAIMIILTDARADDEKFQNGKFVKGTFAAIKRYNVNVFPVGISANRDERQLKGLAGKNDVTYAEGFGDLASHLSELASQTCPNITTPSPTTMTT